jgi:uncharacterized protein YndB with AHSA1/START domain
MSLEPSGRLIATGVGRDLVLSRTFAAGIEDVWASITEPERTARWIASWTDEAGPGKTIKTRWLFEEGAPESEMLIEACEPPRRLAVRTDDEYGLWRLEASLEQAGELTTLELVHHLDERAEPRSIGPGWEYYLDMLGASRAGNPLPEYDDYLVLQPHYEQLAPE